MFRNDKGFTLIELMVVVLILGILMAIAIPVFTSASARAEQRACEASMTTVERAWEQYVADQEGSVTTPADWAGLMDVLIADAAGESTYVKTEPVCKTVGPGAYSAVWDTTTNVLTVSCSEHGTAQD